MLHVEDASFLNVPVSLVASFYSLCKSGIYVDSARGICKETFSSCFSATFQVSLEIYEVQK